MRWRPCRSEGLRNNVVEYAKCMESGARRKKVQGLKTDFRVFFFARLTSVRSKLDALWDCFSAAAEHQPKGCGWLSLVQADPHMDLPIAGPQLMLRLNDWTSKSSQSLFAETMLCDSAALISSCTVDALKKCKTQSADRSRADGWVIQPLILFRSSFSGMLITLVDCRWGSRRNYAP